MYLLDRSYCHVSYCSFLRKFVKFGMGHSFGRREDVRLVTGEGRFMDEKVRLNSAIGVVLHSVGARPPRYCARNRMCSSRTPNFDLKSGQLMTASFLGYRLPQADNPPSFEFQRLIVPTSAV